MQVLDTEHSERGEQRRKDNAGRLIHCCCICGLDAIWSGSWSYYGSLKQLDDGEVLPKFCSDACRFMGGKNACKVTDDMKALARAKEWREPKQVYRPANEAEKFRAALDRQKHR